VTNTTWCQQKTFPTRCFLYTGEESVPDWAKKCLTKINGDTYRKSGGTLSRMEVGNWCLECFQSLIQVNPHAFEAQYELIGVQGSLGSKKESFISRLTKPFTGNR
jgi:hypothetical protein